MIKKFLLVAAVAALPVLGVASNIVGMCPSNSEVQSLLNEKASGTPDGVFKFSFGPGPVIQPQNVQTVTFNQASAIFDPNNQNHTQSPFCRYYYSSEGGAQGMVDLIPTQSSLPVRLVASEWTNNMCSGGSAKDPTQCQWIDMVK